MNYPTETEHEAMGQRQRTEDHGKVIFASVFFVVVIGSFHRRRAKSPLGTVLIINLLGKNRKG